MRILPGPIQIDEPRVSSRATSPSSTSITISLLMTSLASVYSKSLVEVIKTVLHFVASLLLCLGLPLVWHFGRRMGVINVCAKHLAAI